MKTRQSASDPETIVKQLHLAMNRHDLEAFVGCFHPDYRSEQPIHPARAFRGPDQVRKNWSAIFGDVQDFRAEIVRNAVSDDTAWTEWHWHGTHSKGAPASFRGVTLFGVKDGRIVWGRLYMEPEEIGGAGIDEAMRRMTTGSQGNG